MRRTDRTRAYCHTQVGKLILVALGLPILLLLMLLLQGSAGRALPLALLAVLLPCLVLFWSLTVSVDGESLRIRFGVGLVRRSFPLAALQAARCVRNPWWYGWGIRLTPRGWLFNVSGLDAVEISLSTGRSYRIGTDDPAGLLAAIRRHAELD